VKLRDIQPQIRFPVVKQGLILKYEAEKKNPTYLNELDARKPLVVSILQSCEKIRLNNLVQSWTVSKLD
jgi:hypothetical protein